MKEKEIDGKIYILKSDVENTIRIRLEKAGQKLAAAEEQVQTLQGQVSSLQNDTSSTETLQAQIDDLNTQLQSSQNKFERYQSIARLGYGQDQEIVDAIEWSYERAQSKLPKKDKTDLATWLQQCTNNPDNAPSILRPHLQNIDRAQVQSLGETAAAETTEQIGQPSTPPAQNMPAQNIIATNHGVQPTPDPHGNIIDRGIKDPDFYRQNREAIKKAWQQRARSTLREG
jgi:predicted DNA-binding protein (MmcQ/YjbR family)